MVCTYFDGTAVGVVSLVEEFWKELFVEPVDGVVKGQEDQLWNLFFGQVARDVVASAEAAG